MIKMVFCVRKRGDVSNKDFYAYWLNKHGPLVKSFREALCINKYVQSHTGFEDLGKQTREQRDMMPGYDGFAELWWDDAETLQAAVSSAEGQLAGAALLEDEAMFIDLAKSTISFTEEHVIFE